MANENWQAGKTPSFEAELRSLINRRSMENDSDTPDYMLAKFLVRCLDAFTFAVNSRETWHGRGKDCGQTQGAANVKR